MRALESLYRSERITAIDFHFARLIARLDGHERTARVDRLAGLGLPALFLALLALCMLW